MRTLRRPRLRVHAGIPASPETLFCALEQTACTPTLAGLHHPTQELICNLIKVILHELGPEPYDPRVLLVDQRRRVATEVIL